MRTTPLRDRPAGHRRRPGAQAAVPVVAALALIIAGCGGTSPKSGVAHLGTSAPSSTAGSSSAPPAGSGGGAAGSSQLASQAVAYGNCMRSHGVPNFPDPKVSVHGGGVSVAVRAEPGPKFNSAQQACHNLLPGGGPGSHSEPQLSPQEQAQVLKFAACVRAHGVPNLPDPTFTGGGVHLPPTINTHTSAFKSAEQACQALIPPSLRGGGH